MKTSASKISPLCLSRENENQYDLDIKDVSCDPPYPEMLVVNLGQGIHPRHQTSCRNDTRGLGTHSTFPKRIAMQNRSGELLKP
jgi:hypothetical protein